MKMVKKEIYTRLFVLATMLVSFVNMAHAINADEEQPTRAVFSERIPELTEEQKVGLVDLKYRMGYQRRIDFNVLEDGSTRDHVFPLLYRERYYEDSRVETDTILVIDPAGVVPSSTMIYGANSYVANPYNYMKGENQILEEEFTHYPDPDAPEKNSSTVWKSKKKLTLNGDALFSYSVIPSLEPEITFKTPKNDLYMGFDYEFDGIQHIDETFYSGDTDYLWSISHGMYYELDIFIYRFFEYNHYHGILDVVAKTPESGLLFYHELFKLKKKEFSGVQRLPSTEEHILIYTFSFSMESVCDNFVYDTSDEVTIYVTKPTTEKSIQNAKRTFELNGLTYDYW